MALRPSRNGLHLHPGLPLQTGIPTRGRGPSGIPRALGPGSTCGPEASLRGISTLEPPLLCGGGGGSSQPPNSTLGSSERFGLSLNPHVQCWATVSGCLGALQGGAIITAALDPMSPRAGSAGQHEGMVAGHPVHPVPAVLNVLFVIPWSLTTTQIYSPFSPPPRFQTEGVVS